MYIHFFLSVCVCVCLLDPISFNWLPFFFLSLPCPRLPFQIFQTRLQCFACVCVCMSRFLLLSMLLLLLLLFHCAFRVCFVVAVALFSSACFPPFHYFYYFQYFQYIASGKLDLAPSWYGMKQWRPQESNQTAAPFPTQQKQNKQQQQ